MARDYYIEFKTKEAPGLLMATRVSLATEFIRDMDRKLAINLADDPLYPALYQYVKNNPPREPKE